MHVPAAIKLIVDPLVPLEVHTGAVNDENDTAKPDDAVADTVTGDCNNVTFANAPNVMVWFAFDTVNDC